jgi:hypothetical protein
LVPVLKQAAFESGKQSRFPPPAPRLTALRPPVTSPGLPLRTLLCCLFDKQIRLLEQENKIIFALKIAMVLSFKRAARGKLKSKTMILMSTFALKNQ